MKVSSSLANTTLTTGTNSIKTNFTEKISKDEAEELRLQVVENANLYAMKSLNIQQGLNVNKSDSSQANEGFKSFLKEIGYEGKPIASLSQDEASALVTKDGFFGVEKTSKRIADFVINGAAGDENRLRAGREGMLEGFKMAEKMWGNKLPEISQETMRAATEMIDKAMMNLGFSLIDTEV